MTKVILNHFKIAPKLVINGFFSKIKNPIKLKEKLKLIAYKTYVRNPNPLHK